MTKRFGPLVEAGWLREHVHDPDIRVIDFRWYLQGRNGRQEYERGHIPGAVFVDLESITGKDGAGRHPLPTAAQFEGEMRKAGVGPTTSVVVYDDTGGSVAARLWFLLGYFGHAAQAVLDGGLQAWGEPLETEVRDVRPGELQARAPDARRVVDFETVRAIRDVPVLDARAGERYRGETEPIDPKAGHIPGALSAPYAGNLGPDGRFKSSGDLRRRYEELGATGGAVVYCGSGVNACHHLLAMEVAGIANGRLYAGAWSDWSRRDAPVAIGPEP
ncbi:MAG TPA: sulfurtransferase [Candidatus Sulfotelmatobacter sp.]|nr:sulfurtransferase [Candidatus Sulfotelmatobacter sp.]